MSDSSDLERNISIKILRILNKKEEDIGQRIKHEIQTQIQEMKVELKEKVKRDVINEIMKIENFLDFNSGTEFKVSKPPVKQYMRTYEGMKSEIDTKLNNINKIESTYVSSHRLSDDLIVDIDDEIDNYELINFDSEEEIVGMDSEDMDFSFENPQDQDQDDEKSFYFP
jgi:hypothetical protein